MAGVELGGRVRSGGHVYVGQVENVEADGCRRNAASRPQELETTSATYRPDHGMLCTPAEAGWAITRKCRCKLQPLLELSSQPTSFKWSDVAVRTNLVMPPQPSVAFNTLDKQ